MSDSAALGDAVAARAAAADGGPAIAALLGEVDVTDLSRRGRIDALVACERMRSWAEAQQQHVLAALAVDAGARDESADPVARIEGQLDKQWVREEVACALRIATPTAAARLALATELSTRFPQMLALLAAGRVSAPMARRWPRQPRG